jgi:tryptophan synthase alpha chain
MQRAGLDTVFLAAPTSTDRRLQMVATYSTGFVYLVSRTGVTGEQVRLSASAAELVQRMRSITDLPLAVGFGISTPDHVREIGSIADGVVVGSAIVRTLEDHRAGGNVEEGLERYMRSMTAGLPLRRSA